MSDNVSDILEVRNLRKHFPVRSGVFSRPSAWVKAVDDVSFSIGVGEVVGLVGESGSGKSTVARTIVRLLKPTSGQVLIEGTDVSELSEDAFRPFRRRVQMVFQDPYASLNPRMTAGEAIGEAFKVHGLSTSGSSSGSGPAGGASRVTELLDQVGLSKAHADRYPHEFSGGQRQRIGIARALAVAPSLLIADEPVSALDVSVQAQVVNLLQDLRDQLGLAMLFVAHDLSVVEHLSDRVAVMYLGKIVEIAKSESLFSNARHPYTQALLSAIPIPDPRLRNRDRSSALEGDLPSPMNPPSGCVFRTRCPIASSECAEATPLLKPVDGAPGHVVACLKQ